MENAPSGKQTLEFIRHGYELQTYPSGWRNFELVLINDANVDLGLREIISLATNKTEMLSHEDAEVLKNFMFSTDPYSPEEHIFEYNLEQALQLVEEKNLTDKPLRIITNPGVPYRDKAFNVLAEALESIGLGVETELISFIHILNILQASHDYDLVVVGLGFWFTIFTNTSIMDVIAL